MFTSVFLSDFQWYTFRVSFTGENVGEKIKLNNTQKNIINTIKHDKYVTQVEISKKLNRTVRTVERNMKMLQDANIVVRVGSDTLSYWEIVE